MVASPFADSVFSSTVFQPNQHLLLHRVLHDDPHLTDTIAALLHQVELETAAKLHSSPTPELVRGEIRGVRAVRAYIADVFASPPRGQVDTTHATHASHTVSPLTQNPDGAIE